MTYVWLEDENEQPIAPARPDVDFQNDIFSKMPTTDEVFENFDIVPASEQAGFELLAKNDQGFREAQAKYAQSAPDIEHAGDDKGYTPSGFLKKSIEQKKQDWTNTELDSNQKACLSYLNKGDVEKQCMLQDDYGNLYASLPCLQYMKTKQTDKLGAEMGTDLQDKTVGDALKGCWALASEGQNDIVPDVYRLYSDSKVLGNCNTLKQECCAKSGHPDVFTNPHDFNNNKGPAQSTVRDLQSGTEENVPEVFVDGALQKVNMPAWAAPNQNRSSSVTYQRFGTVPGYTYDGKPLGDTTAMHAKDGRYIGSSCDYGAKSGRCERKRLTCITDKNSQLFLPLRNLVPRSVSTRTLEKYGGLLKEDGELNDATNMLKKLFPEYKQNDRRFAVAAKTAGMALKKRLGESGAGAYRLDAEQDRMGVVNLRADMSSGEQALADQIKEFNAVLGLNYERPAEAADKNAVSGADRVVNRISDGSPDENGLCSRSRGACADIRRLASEQAFKCSTGEGPCSVETSAVSDAIWCSGNVPENSDRRLVLQLRSVAQALASSDLVRKGGVGFKNPNDGRNIAFLQKYFNDDKLVSDIFTSADPVKKINDLADDKPKSENFKGLPSGVDLCKIERCGAKTENGNLTHACRADSARSQLENKAAELTQYVNNNLSYVEQNSEAIKQEMDKKSEEVVKTCPFTCDVTAEIAKKNGTDPVTVTENTRKCKQNCNANPYHAMCIQSCAADENATGTPTLKGQCVTDCKENASRIKNQEHVRDILRNMESVVEEDNANLEAIKDAGDSDLASVYRTIELFPRLRGTRKASLIKEIKESTDQENLKLIMSLYLGTNAEDEINEAFNADNADNVEETLTDLVHKLPITLTMESLQKWQEEYNKTNAGKKAQEASVSEQSVIDYGTLYNDSTVARKVQKLDKDSCWTLTDKNIYGSYLYCIDASKVTETKQTGKNDYPKVGVAYAQNYASKSSSFARILFSGEDSADILGNSQYYNVRPANENRMKAAAAGSS